MDSNPSIESTLSISRFIQGKYLKDVENLFPMTSFTLNDLPFEIFLQFCEDKKIDLKPLAPKGFSQDFEIKRIHFQFPFGEFSKLDLFKLKRHDPDNSFSELHEGIYLGQYKKMPFVICNMIIYMQPNPGIVSQLLFIPKGQESKKDELLNDFSDYFISEITKTRPFQIDNFIPYMFKKAKWSDMFGNEDKIKEYKAFFDSRLNPPKSLLKTYEDALPSTALIGPTGCGKSFLLNVIMTEYSDYKFFMFRPSDEISPFMALDFIERSKKYPKRIYIFEELDSLAESMAGLQIWRHVIEEGVEKGSGDTAMVIATSSYPEILKTAVEFRPDLFGQVFRFDYPNDTVRSMFIKKHLETKDITDDGWKKILNETDGFSFAWLKDVVRKTVFETALDKKVAVEKALLEAIREVKSRMNAVKDKFPQNAINRKFGFSK